MMADARSTGKRPGLPAGQAVAPAVFAPSAGRGTTQLRQRNPLSSKNEDKGLTVGYSNPGRHPASSFTIKTDLRDTYPSVCSRVPCTRLRLHARAALRASSWSPIPKRICGYGPTMVRHYAASGLTGATSFKRLWLRAAHRRLGAHCGAGGAGSHGRPHLRRQYGPPDHAYEGFRHHRHLLHAELLLRIPERAAEMALT